MPIQKRYSGWYSRVAVPADLRPIFGRHEIVRSLRTASSREARARCHHVEGKILYLFADLRRHRTTMTTDQLRALADRYLADQLDAAETMAARVIAEAATNPDALEVRADELTDSLSNSTERRFATRAQQRELQLLADSLLAEVGLEIRKDSDAYRRLCLRLLKAQQDAAKAELRLLQGDLAGPPATPAAALPPKITQSTVRLSQAVEQYMAFKGAQGAWTAQTKEIHAATYSELVALVGDKPVTQVSKADLLGYYHDIPQLPTNAAKKWRGMDARQVLDATADMTVPRLSPRSVNKRLVMVRSLFGWMERADLVERDPSGVLEAVPEIDADDRQPFTDSEALALLDLCAKEAEQAAHRLVPRILAYSGLRLDEAAQLARADIVQQDGVWCFRVNADEGK